MSAGEATASRVAPGPDAPTPSAPARLLVVDDNELNRDLLSRRLRRLGHAVRVAEHGAAALAALRAEEADLVLLDVMMPQLNGYEVLERMKADDALRHVPVIMVSANDEMASVVRCIELGAEDYLPKPFDPVLLKARVDASLEKKRLRDRERVWARSMERELEIGREIQRGFFPEALPVVRGWEIAASFESARQVGGDFYDAFPLGRGRVAIAVGDVCDKGVGAALFMALFRSLLRATAEQLGDDEAATIAARAIRVSNDYIARTHGAANMFATIVFGVLDPVAGELTYVNGGHEPPRLLGSAGVIARLPPTGPAVGMLPEMPFAVERCHIAPGEALLVVTDGVTEARDARGALLGEGVVDAERTDAGGASALLARLRDAVRRHVGEAERSDDVTMLAVWRG